MADQLAGILRIPVMLMQPCMRSRRLLPETRMRYPEILFGCDSEILVESQRLGSLMMLEGHRASSSADRPSSLHRSSQHLHWIRGSSHLE